LYKFYGLNQISGSNVTELSRILIQFDLTDLTTLYSQQKINVTNNTFNVTLKLFDVYGGQSTPEQFTLNVYPLSRSFSEGKGRDIVKYSDLDSCNFLSSTYNNLWGASGAYQTGTVPASCDYYSALGNLDLKSSQYFTTGEENLEIDVTNIISATLTNQINNSGFLIAYDATHENDDKSYFVKRFASRTAYNVDYHPRLIVRYDDSMQDNTQNLELNTTNTLYLYNYRFGTLANIISGTLQTELTGTNCLYLKLSTPVTSGTYIKYFNASQLNFLTGTYSSNVLIQPAGPLYESLLISGSLTFDAEWLSRDKTVLFGRDSFTFNNQTCVSTKNDYSQYTITAIGVKESHKTNEKVNVRVNIFDYKSPMIKLVKAPLELAGIVIPNAYYQIRDYLTSEEIIPFDTTYKSTKLSSDKNGMYFDLDMSNLKNQRSYIIDIMLQIQGNEYIFRDASPVFRIDNLR
jgi:hypothetical protein